MDTARSATEMSSLLTYAVLTHHALFLVLKSGTVWEKRTPSVNVHEWNFPESNRSEEIFADVESLAFFSLHHFQHDYSMAFKKEAWPGTSVGGKAELCYAEKGGVMLLLSAQPHPVHPCPLCLSIWGREEEKRVNVFPRSCL